MANGDLTIGSWLNFNSPLLTEMMASAGFDWLVIDMEHGVSDRGDLVHLVQVIELSGISPLVRLGANDPFLIKQAMDAGACGVVVPMIMSVEDAIAARDALYYPPIGKRGVGLTRAHDFGMDFDTYKEKAQSETVFIVQIEHVDAVDCLSEILDLEHVDGFIIGPYDLSGSLGKPGQFDDPEVAAALDKATQVIKSHAKPGGYHIVHSDQDTLRQRINQGCRFMAYGTEMIFLAEKLQEESQFLAGLKEKLRP